jgi:hypothetical protein
VPRRADARCSPRVLKGVCLCSGCAEGPEQRSSRPCSCRRRLFSRSPSRCCSHERCPCRVCPFRCGRRSDCFRCQPLPLILPRGRSLPLLLPPFPPLPLRVPLSPPGQPLLLPHMPPLSISLQCSHRSRRRCRQYNRLCSCSSRRPLISKSRCSRWCPRWQRRPRNHICFSRV